MREAIAGLASIDRAIKQVAGIGENLNDRVQEIAVAIVDHGANAGNGDMSRALTLCQTVKRMRSLNVAFLVGWFRYFGNCNVNFNANDGKGKVSLVSKDAKGYRGFDVVGAKHNNWFDAFNEKGERSGWYAGPAVPEFQPETVGDIAARMERFVENTGKLLSGEKEIGGKKVPLVSLTDSDRSQVEHGLLFIKRIAATLARHEQVQQLEAKLTETKEAAGSDEAVVAVIAPANEQDGEAPQEQAVA